MAVVHRPSSHSRPLPMLAMSGHPSSAESSPPAMSTTPPSPSLPPAPLSVSDYRDLLLNLKAQNATDLAAPPPPSSLSSAHASSLSTSALSPLPILGSSPDSALPPPPSASSTSSPSRLPLPSAVASRSFAEKKVRLAAQAQQYKTLPTKRLIPSPAVSASTPPLSSGVPPPSSSISSSSQPVRSSAAALTASVGRSLATGPLSPTRSRSPSVASTASPSSSSAPSTAATHPPPSSDPSLTSSSQSKSRSTIFGSHLPPISTESQRLTTAGHQPSGSVGSIGSVLSPSTQQASAPIASLGARARTGSAVTPHSHADMPPPAQSPSHLPPSSSPSTTQFVLPSPRRTAKAAIPAAAFSPSLQARLASHSHPLISPRRRTLDTALSPREGEGGGGVSAVESLQAEFDKLSAEWNEQKVTSGGGLNASFSHGPSIRRALPVNPGSADDSALSQRRQRMQHIQMQYQTLPTSPQRRLVERVYSLETETAPVMRQSLAPPPPSLPLPLSASSSPSSGYVHSSAPHAVSVTLANDSSVDGLPRDHEVGLLADPFADGGEGLLDDDELNI